MADAEVHAFEIGALEELFRRVVAYRHHIVRKHARLRIAVRERNCQIQRIGHFANLKFRFRRKFRAANPPRKHIVREWMLERLTVRILLLTPFERQYPVRPELAALAYLMTLEHDEIVVDVHDHRLA